MFFIGELSPLMLRDIKEKGLLLSVIFVVRDGIMFVAIDVAKIDVAIFFGVC